MIDMFEEARSLELHDRLRIGRRGVHDPARLLEAASRGAATAIGWSDIGALQVGSPADFLVLDPDSYGLAGADSLAGVAFAATRADVSDVYVAGNQVVAHRRHAGSLGPGTLSGGLAAVAE